MLRSLVLILLLVNAAFFAWRQGWLNEVVGVRPDGQREPGRLAQQVHPDKIVVPPRAETPATEASPEQPGSAQVSEAAAAGADNTASASSEAASPDDGQAASSAATDPSAATADNNPPPAPASVVVAPASNVAATKPGKALCVEAGPFTAAEYASVEALLRPQLPSAVWTKQTVNLQGMWLVYMGPYPEAEQLQRKQEELKRIKDLDFEVVRTPANLAPGISLGRFSKQDNAENQLEMLRNKGIRTARIVNLRPAQELYVLRMARADVDTQLTLSGLKLPQGKGFTACRR